jgi:hypothetical protein
VLVPHADVLRALVRRLPERSWFVPDVRVM